MTMESVNWRASATLVAALAIAGVGTVVPAGAGDFDVLNYGAVCDDPTVDSTPSFQAALNDAANANGGTVWVPRCRFWFNGNLVMGHGVALAGRGIGPYDPYWFPDAFTQGPTLLPKATTASGPAFISVSGTNSAVENLLFFYPDQVSPLASEPDVYPPTLLVSGPSKIMGCMFTNSYIAIHIMVGRVFLEKLHIGGFKNDIIVDNAADVVHISQVTASLFWDFGLVPPQPLDYWVLQNGAGITSYQADGLSIHDVLVHYRNIGIAFLNSPVVYGGTTYGKASDIDLDGVNYGVVAQALNGNAGFQFTNLNIGSEISGAHMIWLQAGAVPPNAPRMVVNGGSTRNLWQKTLRVDAGTLVVRDVIGLNPIGRLPALGMREPPLPNSGVPYVSNLPAEGRVMISGGSVSDVRIGGHSTGLISGMFIVAPGESIAIVYSAPPSWSWFLN
jgi:hypothetical protein